MLYYLVLIINKNINLDFLETFGKKLRIAADLIQETASISKRTRGLLPWHWIDLSNMTNQVIAGILVILIAGLGSWCLVYIKNHFNGTHQTNTQSKTPTTISTKP